MFGFLLKRKQDEARRVLARQQNLMFGQQVRTGPRVETRGGYMQPAWVIPICPSTDVPKYSRAFPAMTRDISSQGLSIIHSGRIDATELLIGLPAQDDVTFLRFEVVHETQLGCGFRQYGLHVRELSEVPPDFLRDLREMFTKLDAEPQTANV